MLKCNEVSEQASEIVDGNVKGMHKLKVQMHLMMCTHCRSFVKKIKMTKGVISKLTLEPVPDDKLDKIMQGIEDDQKNNSSK